MVIYRIRGVVALILGLGFASAARGAFVNDSFETGNFNGWTVTSSAPHGVATEGTAIAGTDLTGNYVHARTGDFAAWMALAPSGPDSTITFSQDVLVEPGVQYQAAFRVGIFTTGAAQLDFTRQWTIDGVARPVIPAIGTSGSFAESMLTTAAFDGAPRVVTYSLTIGRVNGATLTRGFSIDDITHTPVPEPSLTAAIALAAMAGLTQRRRGRCITD